MCVCVSKHSRDSNCSRTVLPPPFTNTCIILSGRKGPVSCSLLSSDTSQTFEGIAEVLMMPLLKARTYPCGITGRNNPANDLIPPCVTVVDEAYSVSTPPSVVHSFLCSHLCFFVSFRSVCCPTCPPDALSVFPMSSIVSLFN